MKRFKKILFVNDDKTSIKTALDRAVNLAKANKALLTVVQVVEEFPTVMEMGIALPDQRVLQELVYEESNKRLENLIEPIK